MKRILLTGASGYLGNAFLQNLMTDPQVEVELLSVDKSRTQALVMGKNYSIYDYEDLASKRLNLQSLDMVIHFGFARPYRGEDEIKSSLLLSRLLISAVADIECPSFLNISSRSVYGLAPKPWTEQTIPEPDSDYARAKMLVEKHIEIEKQIHPSFCGSSVRLATIAGSSYGMVDVFVLNKFVLQALKGETISIRGGDQMFDILDIRDTCSAVIQMIKKPAVQWKPIYDLGANRTVNIVDLAQKCIESVSKLIGGCNSKIEIWGEQSQIDYTMSSDLFYHDFCWTPEIPLQNTIDSLVHHYQSTGG